MVLLVLRRCGEMSWWWGDGGGGGGWLLPSYSAPNTCGLYSLPPPPAPSVQRRQQSSPDPSVQCRSEREDNQWADMTFICCDLSDHTLTATHDAWQHFPPAHPAPSHCQRRREQELHIETWSWFCQNFYLTFLFLYMRSCLLFPMLALLGQGRRRNKLPISDAAVSSDQEAGKDKPKASGSRVLGIKKDWISEILNLSGQQVWAN